MSPPAKKHPSQRVRKGQNGQAHDQDEIFGHHDVVRFGFYAFSYIGKISFAALAIRVVEIFNFKGVVLL